MNRMMVVREKVTPTRFKIASENCWLSIQMPWASTLWRRTRIMSSVSSTGIRTTIISPIMLLSVRIVEFFTCNIYYQLVLYYISKNLSSLQQVRQSLGCVFLALTPPQRVPYNSLQQGWRAISFHASFGT